MIEAGGGFYTSNTYTFGTAEESYQGSWGASPVSTQNDLVVTPIVNKVPANIGGYNTPGVSLSSDGAEVSLFNTDQYLFLIPVANYQASSTDAVKVTFKYDIVTYDDALDKDHSVTTAIKTVTLPAETLAQGKAYKYTFTFGLHEVKVTANVASWETEGSGGNADVNWTDVDNDLPVVTP